MGKAKRSHHPLSKPTKARRKEWRESDRRLAIQFLRQAGYEVSLSDDGRRLEAVAHWKNITDDPKR